MVEVEQNVDDECAHNYKLSIDKTFSLIDIDIDDRDIDIRFIKVHKKPTYTRFEGSRGS